VIKSSEILSFVKVRFNRDIIKVYMFIYPVFLLKNLEKLNLEMI